MTLEIGLDEILKIPEYLFGKASDAVFLDSRFLLWDFGFCIHGWLK